MAHDDVGFPLLPAYAARASVRHKLGLEAVDSGSRATIVFSGVGPREVPIHMRADGIVIFEFDRTEAYSGGGVEPYHVDDRGGAPKVSRQQTAARNALRETRYQYMNAFLTCFHVAANITDRLSPPLSQDQCIWARRAGNAWQLGEYRDFEIEVIDKVRKKRNEFMHSLGVVTGSDAFEAIHACGIVAKKALNLELSTFGNAGGWDYKR